MPKNPPENLSASAASPSDKSAAFSSLRLAATAIFVLCVGGVALKAALTPTIFEAERAGRP